MAHHPLTALPMLLERLDKDANDGNDGSLLVMLLLDGEEDVVDCLVEVVVATAAVVVAAQQAIMGQQGRWEQGQQSVCSIQGINPQGSQGTGTQQQCGQAQKGRMQQPPQSAKGIYYYCLSGVNTHKSS